MPLREREEVQEMLRPRLDFSPARSHHRRDDHEDNLRGLQRDDGSRPCPADSTVLTGRHPDAGTKHRRLDLAHRHRVGRRHHLAIDDRYGLVGVPDWDTLVHLDDEDTQDFARVQDEFQGIHQRSVRSFDEEWRTFQLLTISEFVAPPELKTGLAPGYFSSQRAEALLMLGKADLALIEIEEARRLGSVEPVRSGCRDLKDRDA